jgi:uncharacterized protein (DUF488 family)
VILTLGHSVRPQEETVALLQENQVALLVDVRAFPRSRRNPQYNSDAFAAALQATGIAYRHMRSLGGMREPKADSVNQGLAEGFRGYADYMQTPEFGSALSELMEQPPLGMPSLPHQRRVKCAGCGSAAYHGTRRDRAACADPLG